MIATNNDSLPFPLLRPHDVGSDFGFVACRLERLEPLQCIGIG